MTGLEMRLVSIPPWLKGYQGRWVAGIQSFTPVPQRLGSAGGRTIPNSAPAKLRPILFGFVQNGRRPEPQVLTFLWPRLRVSRVSSTTSHFHKVLLMRLMRL